MTRTIDRVVFAMLLIQAATGFSLSGPAELAPGSSAWTVLHALLHVIGATACFLWGIVELFIGLRAWWKVIRS